MDNDLIVPSPPADTEDNTTNNDNNNRRPGPRSRPSIPPQAISIQGSIPQDQVPSDLDRRRFGNRRWQDIGLGIIEAAQNGNALVVKLEAGYRTDILRSGLSEELKRHGYRLTSRWQTNQDGSVTMYLVGQPLDDQPK